jgi:N-acetylglucosaminyl-diphospho-decaprenol L-rhamnosyltransferase
VDNDSDDDPAGAAGGWGGRGEFIPLSFNRGFGAANNVGVSVASHEAIVLLNPDCELVDASIERLASEAFRLRGLVGPRMLNPDGSPQPSASGPPVGPWPWLGAILPGAVLPGPLQARTEPWRLSRRTRVAWLTGACLAAPKVLLQSLGPFDERIHLYGEDMDLGLRAGLGGVDSYFSPELACVIHHQKGSSARRFETIELSRLMASNRRAVLRRSFGSRRERFGTAAARLNLELRARAKHALGLNSTADDVALQGMMVADPGPDLAPITRGRQAAEKED